MAGPIVGIPLSAPQMAVLQKPGDRPPPGAANGPAPAGERPASRSATAGGRGQLLDILI